MVKAKFTNDLGGADIANLMYGTSTFAIANGTMQTANTTCVLTNKGWTDVASNLYVNQGAVVAQDFIKLKPKTYLYVYDLKVVDLRYSPSRDEDDRIKLNVIGGCIEVTQDRDAKEAIKLRHAADFANIKDIEYMSVLITNLNSYEIEQKVD